jgi:hypothetical protein
MNKQNEVIPPLPSSWDYWTPREFTAMEVFDKQQVKHTCFLGLSGAH